MRMVWRDLAKHGFALPADIGHAALIGRAASAMISESVGGEYRGGGSYAYACTVGCEPRRARCGCRRRSTISTQASGAAQATCARRRGVVFAFCSRRASMVDALAQSLVRRAREFPRHTRVTRHGAAIYRRPDGPLHTHISCLHVKTYNKLQIKPFAHCHWATVHRSRRVLEDGTWMRLPCARRSCVSLED